MKNSVSTNETVSDLHLIFPPQWTPYQPFLSTPSLMAYLRRCGFAISQSDWNVDFYHFFINRDRLPLAQCRLRKYITALQPEHEVYRARSLYALAVLEDYDEHFRLTAQLRDKKVLNDLPEMQSSITAFYRLLDAFSAAEPVIDVGSSSFSAHRVLGDITSLDAFTQNRTDNPFIEFFERQLSNLPQARYFGLSIIGTEQVVPGMTLARVLKSRYPEIPVIVGGSVFSRLVERTEVIQEFFGKYFDYVCRYEGELPMKAFLAAVDPMEANIPNIAFVRDGLLVKNGLGPQLVMDEVPTPDFSDLPLDRYFSPDLVLPLLATRGCYWDKCAFCYHGMVYQNRYRMRRPQLILEDVETLDGKCSCRHFAFNDEAIPPLLFKKLPDVMPSDKYAFTALYKFEKVYTQQDYDRMYRIGFRSFYIGLETASERVQRHMHKDNLQATMLANLRAADKSGIWNHTFAFFGFPTETESEAQETIDFLIQNADIVHSEGTGTFSFEHNAPIYKDPERFGVKSIVQKGGNVLELYYDYEPLSGLDAEGAQQMLNKFTARKAEAKVHQVGHWIPREHLLLLLKTYGKDGLKQGLEDLQCYNPDQATVGSDLRWFSFDTKNGKRVSYVVGLKSGKVYETNEDVVMLLDILIPDTSISSLVRQFPTLSGIAA